MSEFNFNHAFVVNLKKQQPTKRGVRMSCFCWTPFTPVSASWLLAVKRERVNRRLEFEQGAWFEGFCDFALVSVLSQMMEHGLGPFGRADLHPRRKPLDRQGLKTKVQSPKSKV